MIYGEFKMLVEKEYGTSMFLKEERDIMEEREQLKAPQENNEEEGSVISYADKKLEVGVDPIKVQEVYPSAVAPTGDITGATFSNYVNFEVPIKYPFAEQETNIPEFGGNKTTLLYKIPHHTDSLKKRGMTKAEYKAYHSNMCEKMKAITAAKNSDYTGHTSDDPFANFRQVEEDGITTTEIGFLTRMSDKWSRIRSLVKSGGVGLVLSESLEDTLLDMANYCILFAGYLKSKQMENK